MADIYFPPARPEYPRPPRRGESWTDGIAFFNQPQDDIRRDILWHEQQIRLHEHQIKALKAKISPKNS